MNNETNVPKLLRGESIALDDFFQVALLRREDIPEIVTMLNDPEMTEYLFFAPAPPEVYRAYFEPLAESIESARQEGGPIENVVLTVRAIDEGTFVGDIGLVSTMFCDGNYEIGFQIDRPFQGRGVATAGAKLLTKIAFDELNSHKVSADLYAGNAASARVLTKLGYVQEGRLEKFYRTDGGFADKLYFGITREQYLESRAA